MNLQLANFENLLATYYYGTAAHKAAEQINALIRSEQNLQLATLLRDYRIRAIYSKNEIELRAGTDRLMNCFSAMEIASLAGFISELQHTDFGNEMLPLLENKNVRQYYEEFYPTKLPKLFRCRLAGTNCVIEKIDHIDSSVGVMAFLFLDRSFMEKLEDGYLLRMLDSFSIQGYRFSDVVEVISKPEEFINYLLLAPEKSDALSRALNEFSLFMQFCFDLRTLLEKARLQPLLQSAMWNHYSYWFDIIGEKLNERLGDALSQFLKWKPKGDDKNATKEIQNYVYEARTVLKSLTSRKLGEPLDELIKKVSG